MIVHSLLPCRAVAARASTKRRWRIRQMNPEPGETVLGRGWVGSHDEGSLPLEPPLAYGADAYGFSPMITLATKAVMIPKGRFTSSR